MRFSSSTAWAWRWSSLNTPTNHLRAEIQEIAASQSAGLAMRQSVSGYDYSWDGDSLFVIIIAVAQRLRLLVRQPGEIVRRSIL